MVLNLLACLHVDVLLEGVEVEKRQYLVSRVVGPVGGEHLLFHRTRVPLEMKQNINYYHINIIFEFHSLH